MDAKRVIERYLWNGQVKEKPGNLKDSMPLGIGYLREWVRMLEKTVGLSWQECYVPAHLPTLPTSPSSLRFLADLFSLQEVKETWLNRESDRFPQLSNSTIALQVHCIVVHRVFSFTYIICWVVTPSTGERLLA
jgi:hypothetical protein